MSTTQQESQTNRKQYRAFCPHSRNPNNVDKTDLCGLVKSLSLTLLAVADFTAGSWAKLTVAWLTIAEPTCGFAAVIFAATLGFFSTPASTELATLFAGEPTEDLSLAVTGFWVAGVLCDCFLIRLYKLYPPDPDGVDDDDVAAAGFLLALVEGVDTMRGFGGKAATWLPGGRSTVAEVPWPFTSKPIIFSLFSKSAKMFHI